ncbi:MAG: shikimate dehydrogenase [Actinobacteria bacterium]|nr:shikimate dehydrogenase [Actinomycetota bacterium]MBU1493149.1 shikimate dehydrogenase [Actinomycetota bacterium]MBU1866141.1 shikimate dehydrogenase [Actinomycetota bacterium]
MRLVVLGDPVAHSRSPAIHTAALAAVGLTGSYEARRVDAGGFLAAADDLRRGRLDGANVTMPHKALAAATADCIDGLVAATGAANTLRRSTARAGEIEATNTDVAGLRSAAAAAGIPSGAPVLVLGGGGAAAAALAAFGDREVRCATRSGSAVPVATHPWGVPWPGAVVVNATPLGMQGEPLPAGIVEAACGLIDMAYGADPTPAFRQAVRMGIAAADGLDVLVGQAAVSFSWWTGVDAPLGVMAAAARRG